MSNVSAGFAAPTLDPARFAERLQAEIDLYWNLLVALVDLRDSDDRARPAIEALLDLPAMRRLRCGWELWDCIVIGEGYDPDDVLIQYLDPCVLDLARDALWDPFPFRAA